MAALAAVQATGILLQKLPFFPSFPVREYIEIADKNPPLWNRQVSQSEVEPLLALCSLADTCWSHTFAMKNCYCCQLIHQIQSAERSGELVGVLVCVALGIPEWENSVPWYSRNMHLSSHDLTYVSCTTHQDSVNLSGLGGLK